MGRTIVQLDKDDLDAIGVPKFDFLGLKTLTVLQTAVALLRKRDINIDLAAIPLDDEQTYAMLARAERLYEEYVQARDQLQHWIARFRSILESQDEQMIREHRRHFGEALDTLEASL